MISPLPPSNCPFASSGYTYGVALQEREARDVVGQILQADFGRRARLANGANLATVHRRLDMPEHMFDSDTHPGARGVGGLLFCRERLVAIGALVDVGGVAIFL